MGATAPTACALPPVIAPVTTGTGHVYVVPAGTMTAPPFTGVTEKVPRLQIVRVCAGMTGLGFTVTVTVKEDPTQAPEAPDVGVTV